MTDIDDQIAHLQTMQQPPDDEMASAPVLDNWTIAPCVGAIERQFSARGAVSGSKKFDDGHSIATSAITSADHAGRWVRTRNTLYRLGAKHLKMPLVMYAAMQPNWITAWLMVRDETGPHTVPGWTWNAALAAGFAPCNGPADWPARRSAAAAVGDELARAGRTAVARAWWLLGTDASDKYAAGNILESLVTTIGIYQTPEMSDIIDGWGMLAKASAETAGEDLSDPIAAARRIGERHQAQPQPLPLVRMVKEPDWVSAAKVFREEWNAIKESEGLLDISEFLAADGPKRRAMASAMIELRREHGRTDHLQVCLRLLALDPTDRIGVNVIKSKIEGYLRDAGSDPETERVARCWRILASGLASPCDPEDPIASAWQLDTPPAIDALRGTDALRELAVDVDDRMSARECGAVVLKKVGGTTETSSGKEAAREFKAIEGKRLRLVCAADLAGIRTTLRDEFPHLHTQIDVLLSDFVEGEPIRFRSTLLCGPPGGGKSRLARRMSECLNVGLHRYDAAGSSDNAFGGTPRRWSSGEHCVPLEAVRRHMIANPWLLIDEIDKCGTSRHNGSLSNSLMPFLEAETAKLFPDPFIQCDLNLSHVSYVLTANDDTALPAPLRDRLRVVRLPEPTIEHLPALARGIVADIAKERAGDARWWPNLEDGELAVVEGLWPGGSVRRLRAIVERILAYREQRPRN
jgi:ATP-dependent Lon protease